ncbi:MAG: hypothetical protein RL404_1531, partial [Pseudomonadota bacterium]
DGHNAVGAMQAGAQHSSAADAGSDDAAATTVEATVEPEAVAEPEAPGQLPGELLAARRLEMRLSIEELSARVKLAPRQLIALEANDFGSLPGMATTRGFIRSCAKTMGMDPEPLLAMVANEPNPALGPMVMRRPLPQPGFNGRRYAPSTSHRRSANKLSGLAAVVLIFVGMLAYIAWRNDWLHVPSLDFSAARDAITASSATTEPPVSEAVPEVAAEQAASKPVAPTAPAAPAAKNAAAPGKAAPAEAEVYAPAAPVPVAPASGTAKAEPAKALPALAANIDPARALELKLREDSWVEVLTQNGERKLVSRLMKAGGTERIEVTEPVILVVGNAAGVDVKLRGQPVSLKPGTRDNVAKLNLK